MSEILDRTAYQRPASFSEATGRMSKNMNYFKINYVLFTAAVLAAFILYNPTSLIILSLVGAAWTYVYLVRTEPLKIGERPVSEREKLLGMSGASLVAVFAVRQGPPPCPPCFRGTRRRGAKKSAPAR